VNISHERIDTAALDNRLARVLLERLVHLVDIRDVAGPDGQVVTHEAVEVGAVSLLAERDLHWPPVILV
jgi:hypothetical protein